MKDKKNIEVELRARLDNVESFKNTINKLGAKFSTTTHICDVYFCNKSATEVEDVEMNAVGSYSLRLRKETGDDKIERATLNTKTITNKGDHHAWSEREVGIEDFSEAAKILQGTEFKTFFKLEKSRSSYHLKDMEICVEDIADFGPAVEIEIMCAPGEEVAAKEKIRQFLHTCGIGDDKIALKSITNMIMKERAFKQKIEL